MHTSDWPFGEYDRTPDAPSVPDVPDVFDGPEPLAGPAQPDQPDQRDDEDQEDQDQKDQIGGGRVSADHRVRRHRRTRPRGTTIAMKRVSLADLELGAAMYPPVEIDRPRTRADCSAEARPCPWVACKHHLYLDINPSTGSIKINFPDREPWELEHTCALDIAEAGGKTLDEIGEITNLTRERIRQLEVRGLLKLRTRRELR